MKPKRPRKPAGGRDPFLAARLRLEWGGRRLPFLAPFSVFSSHRIDAGTRLLLDHLPEGEPESFLDLGCGYGALGLPVAARFPRARGLLVDRDLLALEYARRNASAQGAAVEVLPSLGYRELPPGAAPFDWILSNLPARAGERVFASFLAGGRARLTSRGEMRVVVIEPLAAKLEEAAAARGLELRRAGASERHTVFALGPGEVTAGEPEGEEIYRRDEIEIALPERLRLDRPTDLADEPHRLPAAIPLLAEHLPAEPPRRVLVFRSGYGLVPALVLARYPAARTTAADRDLLALAFTCRNCSRWCERLEVEASIGIGRLSKRGPFDLVLGELSTPLGRAATLLEVAEAREILAAGGRALLLGLAKQWREFLKRAAKGLGLKLKASRGPVALFELERGGAEGKATAT
jgi:16S rRNA (guanine1207-N2)-methyltransferase